MDFDLDRGVNEGSDSLDVLHEGASACEVSVEALCRTSISHAC